MPITEGGVFDWLYHLILPWIALSVLFIGVYSRVVRSSVLDTINDDYVRTARAKGLGEKRVLRRHVLRNSLIPVITLWGLDFGAVLGGGAILTETVFDIQGVGQYFSESISRLDVPPVLVITMFGAFFIVLFNAIVTSSTRLLDPRIRLTTTNGKLLLDVERPPRRLPDRGRRRAGRRRRLLPPRAGRGARDRRRVGLGQVGDGAHAHGPHARA